MEQKQTCPTSVVLFAICIYLKELYTETYETSL